MRSEIWKPVVGAEDSYQISDRGRIRSLSRVIIDGAGRKRILWSKTLKVAINDNGFQQVSLVIDSKRVCRRVNRLIMESFAGPPPSSKHQARYLDGDRTNNDVKNLRWMQRGKMRQPV